MSDAQGRGAALVADDDEFFRLAMATLLRRDHGYETIIEAQSLDEALAMLGDADSRFDLALFDLAMPGMIDAASLIAVRECFPEVKVVVVTASMQRRDVLRALEAGAHGFVSKAQGLAPISDAIAVVLGGAVHVPQWLAMPPRADAPRLLTSGDAPPMPTATTLLPVFAEPIVGVPQLTQRQAEVLALVARGKSNKEIGRALSLAEGTVKVHVAALLRAFNVPTRAAVAAAASRALSAAATPKSSTNQPLV